jgi:peptidoglycan/LPS O-acetylase OafA/YrhL
MVLVFHTEPRSVTWLHGYLGVTSFFVLSGFLITTLLLREEDTSGSVSVSAFYLRRVFRILPLYGVALLVFGIATIVLHLGRAAGTFSGHLPYYLTFTNEFAGSGTFSHSWSLGVEEKFYLVWPAVGFVLLRGSRYRASTVVILLIGTVACTWLGHAYPAIYAPILAGCVMGLIMDRADGFLAARHLTNAAVVLGLLVVAGAAARWDTNTGYDHAVFGLAVALLLPALALRSWLATVFSWEPLVYVGRRSYAVYLFHPLCLSVIDKKLSATSHSVAEQVSRIILAVAMSLLVAEVLHRLIERPAINYGRTLTHKRARLTSAPSV